MYEAISTYTQSETGGAFHIVAPYVGDIVGGALQRAYDDRDALPDDLLYLLDCLDRVD